MQFDLLRAFPYPVLRPRVNDYVDGDIQATVNLEQSSSDLLVRAEIQFVISVPELLELVVQGKARFAVVFACRDTYFRQSVQSVDGEFSHIFEPGVFRGQVIIYPYLVAIQRIEDFSCPWINEEFGLGPFSFEEGAVLALDEPQSIYIEREAFKPISSSFVLVSNENMADQEWRIDPTEDKVRIEVSPALKARLDTARNSNKNRAILLNSIYFGAVVQCLAHLKHQRLEYEGRRWAEIIIQKCSDLGLSIENHDEVIVAQKLMKHPIALLDAYYFGEAGEA